MGRQFFVPAVGNNTYKDDKAIPDDIFIPWNAALFNKNARSTAAGGSAGKNIPNDAINLKSWITKTSISNAISNALAEVQPALTEIGVYSSDTTLTEDDIYTKLPLVFPAAGDVTITIPAGLPNGTKFVGLSTYSNSNDYAISWETSGSEGFIFEDPSNIFTPDPNVVGYLVTVFTKVGSQWLTSTTLEYENISYLNPSAPGRGAQVVSGTVTLNWRDDGRGLILLLNGDIATTTVTLPVATQGMVFYFRCTGSTNPVTIEPAPTHTINNLSSISMTVGDTLIVANGGGGDWWTL